MTIRQIIDRAYKYIFSNPEIFLQLLKYFVHEDFTDELDVNQLEQVQSEFISEEFLKRESDIVYKAKLKRGEVFIFVLLEFQSSRQKRFPLRMLNYISQFYEQYSRKHPGRLLPNVFPLLLYTGKKRWNIPCDCRDLIENNIPDNYIPSMQYYPILLNEIPEQTLLSIHSTVSAMMYLEQAGNKREFQNHIDKIAGLLLRENIVNREQFSHWVNMLFQPERKVDFVDNDRVYLKGGDKPMLVEMPKLFREEGRKEGKLEDKQSVLIRLIGRKFDLPEARTDFIKNINDTEKLDQALDVILFAETAEEVFAVLRE
ncbi:MAG: Rpn family recombination-promoting nuclease/putative transposase [Spirochaetales bacterium]|nr:Rpn family recombination-promoting nuclease/putative transposase [Spirochaetales bacterium]